MRDFEEKDYKVFEMFSRQWAVVRAGKPGDANGCTVSWGSMGTLWTRKDSAGSVITVYLYPSRHTRKYLEENDTFTVSFFPARYRKALGVMGSKSGRDGDKIALAGLTPVAVADSVGFREAELTFLCKKIYRHRFSKDDIAPDVRRMYRSNPASYPTDSEGEWQTHIMFIGEILAVEDKR